jgi:hypothetical protein
VVLTGSSYANGLPTLKEDDASESDNDSVILVDAEPLSYCPTMNGRDVGNDSTLSTVSSGSSEVYLEAIFDDNGREKEEPYGRPKKPIKHISELANMTANVS